MQFTRKTSHSKNILGLGIKLCLDISLIIRKNFALNKIDFPASKKKKKKIIPNENFKIVK